MASRQKRILNEQIDTQAYAVQGQQHSDTYPGKQTSTATAASDKSTTKEDVGFTLSFRIPIKGFPNCSKS